MSSTRLSFVFTYYSICIVYSFGTYAYFSSIVVLLAIALLWLLCLEQNMARPAFAWSAIQNTPSLYKNVPH